ncbi:MAG TPA: DNRLRE domain-containing protein [Gaiellaceae bacterium]|nr:DNRLRE domain-containing protein [Gaiellaceae bacterium]
MPLRLALAIVVGSLASVGVAYAATLGLGSNKLHAWSQTLTKGTCNPSTVLDTYVSQATPNTNVGNAPPTLVVSGAAGAQSYTLVRFDLSSCSLPTTAGADTATLTLTVTTAGHDKISVFPVTSSWDPTTLTWNGLAGLTVGTTATATQPVNSAKAFSFTVTGDVDAAIKAGTLWGWEIQDTSGTATTVISSTANPPSLSISYEK